ncbi:MAG: TonB-dependent receptor plug domain-containing protein [Opitutaceae bacterium]|nr:TonB-dependent receptor plug domain-containing protein [Opitutaceae bacterium]
MLSCTPILRRILFSCLLPVCATFSVIQAAETTKKNFDVPAGEAIATLKQAARQAGVEIMFPASTVRGVTTNAVKGQLTPSQALEQMLAGTGLVVVRDEKTGALAIRRAPAPIRQIPANETSSVEPTLDETVKLSPFTVTETSGSYLATSTLAGTRLRTDVADVGAPLSILTEQLLSDLGATDAGSALVVVPNVEVAGPLGNFAALDQSGAGNNAFFDANGSRNAVSTPQRVRGLVSAELTRGYFQTSIPFDTYNTSQVTVARGPNSVLFGLGSPGGIIENSLKMPGRRNNNEVKVRISHYGGHRETLDINRRFASGRVGFRLAALNERELYRQEEAFRNDRRVFGSWDIKVHQAKSNAFLGDTIVRGYLEHGRINRNPPDILPPTNNYRWWHDVSAYYELIGKYPGINSIADIPALFRTVADGGNWRPLAIVRNGTTGISTVAGTSNTIPVFIGAAFLHANPNEPSAVGGYDAVMPRLRWPGGRGTQDWRITSSHMSQLPGFNNPTLLDRDTFDFVKHLYAGDTATIRDKFNVQEVTLEQQFLQNTFGFELTANRQKMDSYRYAPYNTGFARAISIDISEALPVSVVMPSTGNNPAMLANPNLGRPVVTATTYSQSDTINRRENFRATGFATHDFNKSLGKTWGRWLGHHTLSGLYQETSTNSRRYQETLNWQSDLVDFSSQATFGQLLNDGRRTVNSYIYVGDSMLNTTSADQVRITQFPLSRVSLPVPNKKVRLAYWDNTARQIRETEAYAMWVPHHGSNISEQQVDSTAIILQSSMLDGHLVTIFAERSDNVRNYEIIPAGNERLPSGAFDPATLVLQDTPSSSQKGRTRTKSVVARFPEKYLFELPFGADLRVHYFESQTFEPAGIARNLYNEILPNPSGVTKEHGFGLDLFNRRLSINATWYETSSTGARNNTGMAPINAWIGVGANNYLARAAQWEHAGRKVTEIPGAAAAGFTDDWNKYYDAILSLAPEPFRSAIGMEFNRTTGAVSGPGIQGLSSSFDFVAKGMELELVGSLTDRWNIVLNLAQQQTVQSNTLPGVLAFVRKVEENIIASGLANVSDAPGLAEGDTFLTRWRKVAISPVQNEIAQDGKRSQEQREWRINLVSSYRFTSGRLKGVTVGAVGRWQSKAAIGYAIREGEGDALINDLEHPFFAPGEFNADAFASYRRRIWKNKVDWTLQLNARNLVGGGNNDFIPVSIDPLGHVNAIRTSPERQFLLTSTFRF